jgi:hypothetical protein
MRTTPSHLVQGSHVVIHVEPHLNSLQTLYSLLQVQADLASDVPQLSLLDPRGFIGHEVVLSRTHCYKFLEPRDGIAL